jgi:hypothetical protein
MTPENYVRCWGSDAQGRATPSLAFAAAEQMSEQPGAEPTAERSSGHRRMDVPTSRKREALTGEVDTSLRER